MTQNDLAQAIGYRDSSGVNYHLAGNGPSEEFIRRIAELWPELFGNEMELFLAAKHGRLPGEGVSSLHQRNILMALDSLDAALAAAKAGSIRPQNATPTVAGLWEVYCDRHLPKLATSSQRAYREAFAVAEPLHHVRLHDLTRGHLARLHADLTAERGAALADKVRAVLGSLLGRAEDWGYIEQRPRMPKPNGVGRRERWLDKQEVGRLLPVLADYDDPWGDYFLALLLTGSRPAEVAAMAWRELKLDRAVWMRRQKGGSKVPTHLARPLVQLLQRRQAMTYKSDRLAARAVEWVFPSATSATGHVWPSRKAWLAIAAAAELEDTCIYTLRHTHASWMAEAGASLQIIGGQLGHRQTATTERYAHLSLAPVAAAVESMVEDMVG